MLKIFLKNKNRKLKLVNAYLLLFFLSLISFNNAKAQSKWTLERCIDSANKYNKNLQSSRNNIELNRELQIEAKATLYPKITANAEYKYYTSLPYQLMPLTTFNPAAAEGQFKEAQFGVPHNINANLQLTMPLYNSQLYGAIKNSEIAIETSDLQLKKNEEQLYFEISNLYFNGQIILKQLHFIDSNLLNARRLLETLNLLRDNQLAKSTDLNKIKLQIEQLNTQMQILKNKYSQVINLLKFIMGIKPESPVDIDDEIKYETGKEYKSQPSLEFKISKNQNLILRNELNTLKKSQYIPNMNFFATYGTMGLGYDKKPNEFLNFYPIGFAGVQLSYPMFNGTVTKHKISRKKLELKNSEIQLNILSEQNKMQIENSKLQLFSAFQTIENTKLQIEFAKEIYDQTILQQKQGTASITEVLLADNALREAQQTYIAAVVEYLKAELELKKYSGIISSKN